ncbi:hypothetical protein VMA_001278 [Vibrio mimicus VM223]|nr:hypothetical protein VMA_001278 [Vibrio mimicus VM223]
MDSQFVSVNGRYVTADQNRAVFCTATGTRFAGAMVVTPANSKAQE